MKQFLTCALLLIGLSASGQAIMNIFQNNGSLLQVPLSDIDSITYSFLEYLNPGLTYGTVTDQNGNTYPTIVIGTQEWMAENLRTATYSNGDPIMNLTDPVQWLDVLSTSTGAWAHYENNPSYDMPYGKLYNGFVATDPRNVCPTGWHVPTFNEWTQLSNYLGGDGVSGGKLKSIGTVYWGSNNIGGTNESGFSALGGGIRSNSDGNFYLFLGQSNWWTSTEITSLSAYISAVGDTGPQLNRFSTDNNAGCFIRCLRD